MSADTTTRTDSHHSPGRGAAPGSETRDATDTATDTPAAHLGPAGRVRLRETERAILRARVVTLERALERRERRLANVIEQYEQVLDSRERLDPAVPPAETDDADDDAETGGLVARLRSLFGH